MNFMEVVANLLKCGIINTTEEGGKKVEKGGVKRVW